MLQQRKKIHLDEIKALFFDMDGVLITSLTLRVIPKYVLFKTFYEEELISAFGSLACVPEKIEWQTENLRKELFSIIPLTNDSMEDEVFSVFAKELFDYNLKNGNIKINPVLRSVLPVLASRFTLGIVTNNVCENVKIHLNGWLHFFKGVKTWECMPEKPDSQGFCGLCQELKLKPGEIIFFGDSFSDIETANKAGAWSCAVKWGRIAESDEFKKIERDNAVNPNFLGFIENIDDIMTLFSI